ncbi:MAG TPA: hypothetical protein VEZ17_09490 [Chitinophagaceae bacterium]|nr:hypothetical protein [Chitinophagaceae bacterium]
MSKSAPIAVYQDRIEKLSAERKDLKKRLSVLGWSRFAAIILAVIAFFYLKNLNLPAAFLAATAITAVFLRLVILSARTNDLVSNLDLLLLINRQELDIASGAYTSLPDGMLYAPPLHDFAQDLDIFGRASLYQYINRTTSEQGHQKLAGSLLTPANNSLIVDRQLAAAELAPLLEWRQQLQAYGLAGQVTKATELRVTNWLNSADEFSARYWKTVSLIMPAIILVALVLTIIGMVPTPIFFGFAFIFFIISGAISRKIAPVYQYLDKVVKEVETLSNSLRWIEQENFKTSLLQQLLQQFTNDSSSASLEVKSLKQVLDRMDIRLNPFVFIFLNTFLFWDLHQVLALEKWKRKNKEKVSGWFHTLADMEFLSTIAAVSFNHPGWCYPVLSEVKGVFVAGELGHPLIAESKRVTSSFATTGLPKLALITGSNMAGKSTFLRSVGINLVLAMMGSPVCAGHLTASNMRVMSSMRISDNLEENTSTFYAELKKLKHIIESVNRHEEVFLLLDEILRGTNSLDRQAGSKALIEQLIRKHAVGMLATHDLELAALSKTYPLAITNYHFDVQVANEELFFDYKLKDGVCRSMNASILMKKIGIEL